MAQQIWLLRHGEAEPHGARPDPERRLTERGERQSRAAGEALRAMEVCFHAVVTSPRVRALDTARLACEALGVEPTIDEALSSGFDADGALELAAAAGEDKRVLLVGHNPDFVQIVLDLTGARTEMKKGGVAGIRLRGGGGELLTQLRPRELSLIARTVGHVS